MRRAVGAVALLAACTGGPSPRPAPAPAARAPSSPDADCRASAASPLRRLTPFEYDNTIRDLLGVASRPGQRFPAELGGNGFGNDAASVGFSRLLLEGYFTAATQLARETVADAKLLRAALGCDPATAGEEPCATSFVESFGQRAFRRPLDAGEKDRLLGVYRRARADGDFATGVAQVLRTILQSPQFLYRLERADGALDQWQRATRLSYLLWASMPDAALFAAARDGRLGTRDDVLAQARRMLADPRARQVASYFHRILFRQVGLDGLAKDPQRFPRGTGALLARESERFLDHVVWDGEGDLATLLTASYTFLDGALAKFYGVEGPRDATFQRVQMDPKKRAGIVTHAGLLALLSPGTQTNPVKRGAFVRERLMCDPPPSPPPSLMVVPPKPDKKLTTRENFDQHANDFGCAGCHRKIDPLGFALEAYDHIGLPRTEENGKPIDTRGEIDGTDAAGSFDGPAQLMQRLAKSRDVQRCYVAHWFQFGFGRGESERDRCAIDALDGAFARARGNVQALLLAMTQSDAFFGDAAVPR